MSTKPLQPALCNAAWQAMCMLAWWWGSREPLRSFCMPLTSLGSSCYCAEASMGTFWPRHDQDEETYLHEMLDGEGVGGAVGAGALQCTVRHTRYQ